MNVSKRPSSFEHAEMKCASCFHVKNSATTCGLENPRFLIRKTERTVKKLEGQLRTASIYECKRPVGVRIIAANRANDGLRRREHAAVFCGSPGNKGVIWAWPVMSQNWDTNGPTKS